MLYNVATNSCLKRGDDDNVQTYHGYIWVCPRKKKHWSISLFQNTLQKINLWEREMECVAMDLIL